MIEMLSKLRRSLAVRIVLFLSLALLPVGLLAAMQTAGIVQRADDRSKDLLVGLTQDSALAQRETIQRAFGMAIGLVPLASTHWEDADRCEQHFAAFVQIQDTAVTVGAIHRDGSTLCASNGVLYDFSESPVWQSAVADPRSIVTVSVSAPISGRPVIVIMQPVHQNDVFLGFVFVSVPLERFYLESMETSLHGFKVIAFTSDGEFLRAKGQENGYKKEILPQTRSLKSLAGDAISTFREQLESGETRSFAVVPILEDTIYALGTWQRASIAGGGLLAVPPHFFPIIMWLTSLGVAFTAIHRLVTRHIRRLGRQMRDFADNRTMPDEAQVANASAEIVDIQESFAEMAYTVLRDEAELEQLLHDKNVLLKEVHHRVTNNLQLISSIMSMQMRQVRSPETRAVLQKLQDRVLGLATIHRNLYTSESLSQVNAAKMLTELTDQMLALGRRSGQSIEFERRLEDINLYPDQAVPLNLLVAEATTNALKYMAGARGRNWLHLTLNTQADGAVLLEIANSTAPTVELSGANKDKDTPSEGTGLGTDLMKAFAMQLGGQLQVFNEKAAYTVRVGFIRAGFDPDSTWGKKMGEAPEQTPTG